MKKGNCGVCLMEEVKIQPLDENGNCPIHGSQFDGRQEAIKKAAVVGTRRAIDSLLGFNPEDGSSHMD